jgi:hypothetical protein
MPRIDFSDKSYHDFERFKFNKDRPEQLDSNLYTPASVYYEKAGMSGGHHYSHVAIPYEDSRKIYELRRLLRDKVKVNPAYVQTHVNTPGTQNKNIVTVGLITRGDHINGLPSGVYVPIEIRYDPKVSSWDGFCFVDLDNLTGAITYEEKWLTEIAKKKLKLLPEK